MDLKMTKEFSSDMRILADKIWLGKIEPMAAFGEFNELIKRHYGEIDYLMGDFLYRMFSTYLQIYSFSRLGFHVRRFT